MHHPLIYGEASFGGLTYGALHSCEVKISKSKNQNFMGLIRGQNSWIVLKGLEIRIDPCFGMTGTWNTRLSAGAAST